MVKKIGSLIYADKEFEIQTMGGTKHIVKEGTKVRIEAKSLEDESALCTILTGSAQGVIVKIAGIKVIEELDYEQISENILQIVRSYVHVLEPKEFEIIKHEITEELMNYY